MAFFTRADRRSRTSRVLTSPPLSPTGAPAPSAGGGESWRSPVEGELRRRMLHRMSPARPALRVLVAEDSPATRVALVELLEESDDFILVAAVADADSAISEAAHHQPDVALLDVRMPGGGGLAAARGIQQLAPSTTVVAYSAASDRSSVVQMLRSGARGYLLKGAPADELLDGLRRCAAGDTAVSAPLHGHLVAEMSEIGQRERASASAAQARHQRIMELLEPGRLVPAYQPIVWLANGRISGYEALARFDTEPSGAEDLFHEAHEVGLGIDLELHAARLAVSDFVTSWAGDDQSYLAVNASPGLLYRPALLEALAELPPQRVVVELTEQRQFDTYDQLRDTVALVHERGMRVAVDDAGSGFAGLQRLVDVQPDIIKLDRSLISDIELDPSRRALVTAMRRFADDIGVQVVAEGIERTEQLRVLGDIGIDCGQGYLFGRPSQRHA